MNKKTIPTILIGLIMMIATIVGATALVLTQKGSVTTTANDVWVDNNIIYITSTWGGIQAYSFNGTEFTQLATYTTSYALSVFGDGTYIYIADFNDGLYAFTFDGSNFTSVGNISGTYNNGIWTDGYIYVAKQSYGIEAYSFNGTEFTLLNSTYDADITSNVFGDGTYIYASVTAEGYMLAKLIAYTFDGTSFTKISETNFTQTTGDSLDLWGDGTYIYLAHGDGVKAYSFNGTEFTEQAAVGNTGDVTFSVWGNGTNIYATEYGTGELTAYSFNGTSFTEITNTYSPNPLFLWGDTSYIYVAGEGIGLTAYQLEPECTNDTDCTTCMYCNAGTCNNQTNAQDLKDECFPSSGTGCLNDYIILGDSGNCDGAGSCAIDDTQTNVSGGNVCSAGTDADPDITTNCGIWSDCVTNQTSANEYYVGFVGDGSDVCIDTDWQSSGTIWNATSGYQISTTEHIDTCTEGIICVSNWTCDTFGACNQSNILPCTSMADLNMCGNPFTGNLSDYNDVCTYVPPAIQYREGSDLTGAVVDNGTKIIVGFGRIAILFGLIVAGIGLSYGFRKLVIKK